MNETAENKILLSDILGSIVSSVSHARQIADIASVNLAYVYQRNELLRGLAVPRLRFKTVKIDIPVLIHDNHRGTPPKLNDVFYIALSVVNDLERRVKLAIEKLGFDLQAEGLRDESKISMLAREKLWGSIIEKATLTELRNKIASQLDQRIVKYFQNNNIPVFAEPGIRAEAAAAVKVAIKQVLSDKITAYNQTISQTVNNDDNSRNSIARSLNYADEFKNNSAYIKILDAVCQVASDNCFSTPAVPMEMEVVVDTDEIKNRGGNNDTITRLKFTLLEEGLEWVEDEQGRRLIME